MAKDDFAQNRRSVVAKHDPPLVHISDAAAMLGLSADTARRHFTRKALKIYTWPRPFARGSYYETAAVEAVAEQLSDDNKNYVP